MATRYDLELQELAFTYRAGLDADVAPVKNAITGASASSIIGVGLGGSYTTASLLCGLHEFYTGRLSRPATSLELICNPTLAASSPVFLFSAEGKNPDIIEALRRARNESSRTVHILTNRSDSRLVAYARQLTNVNLLVFELPNRDGYLATNSLLFNAVILARSYGELARRTDPIPDSLDHLRLETQTVTDWLANSRAFTKDVAARGAALVIYSPSLRPVAADLESKLSESALLFCQVADLRSFAHGRHLWLATRPKDLAVLALVEPQLRNLWARTRSLIPSTVPTLTMSFAGVAPSDLLAGLVAQMWLVSHVATEIGTDPGRPPVPPFGRDLHYLELGPLIPNDTSADDHRGEASKRAVLGANWPSRAGLGPVRRALESFKERLQHQEFRALVLDYDGTLCPSGSDGPPAPRVLQRLSGLLEHGVSIGVASGRGRSVRDGLRETLDASLWPNVKLALYGGGWFTTLDASDSPTDAPSEFLSHVTRIVRRLQRLGVPIQLVRPTLPYQVSLRFPDGVRTEQMWFIVADALRQAGLDTSRVQRSAHSIDILEVGIGKSRLIASIVERYKIAPYQIITMGDQGAWPGNDFSLLEHRFSLSVDLPSRRLDRGWNLAPRHKRGVDATLWYLDRMVRRVHGMVTLNLDEDAVSLAPTDQ